jgi:hypothetical protein
MRRLPKAAYGFFSLYASAEIVKFGESEMRRNAGSYRAKPKPSFICPKYTDASVLRPFLLKRAGVNGPFFLGRMPTLDRWFVVLSELVELGQEAVDLRPLQIVGSG